MKLKKLDSLAVENDNGNAYYKAEEVNQLLLDITNKISILNSSNNMDKINLIDQIKESIKN